jgi:hypothetical protein
MAKDIVCPTLEDVLNADQCLENLAGLGEVVYVGVKDDLAAPLTATENTYSAPTFKAGKGLYKIECADETQGITGGSLGYRKGFKQTLEYAVDSVNKTASKVARALNNLDIFFIVPDGDEFQIMYDPNRKCKADSDGIQSNTGKAASDERRTTFSYTLQPVMYSNYYVDIDDIEKLLHDYTAED